MKYQAYNKPSRYYTAPDYQINRATLNLEEKPKMVKEDFKRAWRAFRMSRHIADKISTVYLSYRFNCSEKIICDLRVVNEQRDPLPSRKIIERKRKLEKTVFDDDVPFQQETRDD